ncbi:MAG: hypothetical protein FK733_05000 [Asgard group archaeon]|nr:hypothetical protein [Asgard group archaeon]
MGKAIVIVFAALSLIIVPVSMFYIGDTSVDPSVYSIEIQGRFFDARFGPLDTPGFGFFKFIEGFTQTFFSTDAWNTAYTSEPFLGLATGTFMMILWYVSMGMLLVGIIVAFFKTKLSGLFFVLAFLSDGMQAVVWYMGMNIEITDPNIIHFPIPISALLLIVTFILAFTSKKKDSYYYSPGYSYGYGRR